MNVRNIYTQQCKFVSWDRVIVPEEIEYFAFEKCTTVQTQQCFSSVNFKDREQSRRSSIEERRKGKMHSSADMDCNVIFVVVC